MLLEIAIADAYGLGFEFMPQEFVDANNNLSQYHSHQKYKTVPGTYSDDAQMSIAITNLLLQTVKSNPGKNPTSYLTPVMFADAFYETFKQDPRDGYARGFQSVLEKVSSGAEMIEVIEAHGKTTSNGAAMRACPIGLFFDYPTQVLDVAAIQGSVTHEGTGILAAQIVALATLYMKHRVRINTVRPFHKQVYDYLNEQLKYHKLITESIDFNYDGSRVAGKVDLGLRTAIAAVHCAATTKSYSECLLKAVSFGGDTDSVAAIACGILSASNNIMDHQHDKRIPIQLIDGLEDGPFGIGYLINIDNQLKKYL